MRRERNIIRKRLKAGEGCQEVYDTATAHLDSSKWLFRHKMKRIANVVKFTLLSSKKEEISSYIIAIRILLLLDVTLSIVISSAHLSFFEYNNTMYGIPYIALLINYFFPINGLIGVVFSYTKSLRFFPYLSYIYALNVLRSIVLIEYNSFYNSLLAYIMIVITLVLFILLQLYVKKSVNHFSTTIVKENETKRLKIRFAS